MANQQYMYTLSYGKSVSGMIDAARQYLAAAENMEVQMLNGGSANVTILQARARSGGFKQLVGMDKALTIRFTESGSTANRGIRRGKVGRQGGGYGGIHVCPVASDAYVRLWHLQAEKTAGKYPKSA
ncbi:MAG: hypothetical protein HFF84_11180 [Oscillibacter sp.]|nr:hypothetical protein [Oscillibacter sp.]